jgi:hypothetical protein
MKAECDALGSNFEADDLTAWTEIDEETLVTQHLGKEDTVSSMKNGKTTDALGTSDTGSDSENNGDDSCEVSVPKLRKLIENINEVMIWLEQQTDSEHFHLLHVLNIKQYVLKKCSHLFWQSMLHDCFHVETQMYAFYSGLCQ